jgi:hypothetical protein
VIQRKISVDDLGQFEVTWVNQHCGGWVVWRGLSQPIEIELRVITDCQVTV